MSFVLNDTRRRDYLLPVRILLSKGAVDEQQLLSYHSEQSFFGGDRGCVLKAGGFLLLDFGRELSGGVKIVCNECSGNKNAQIRVRFGESAMESCAELNEKGCTNDHAIRDERLTIPWVGSVEYGNTGFRFIRIDNLSDFEISFRQVFALFIHCGRNYVGSFRCSDDLLNRVFDTAAYTVYLNMQDYIYDGVKRDRVVWIGDLHPETSSIQRLFGDDIRIRKSLDLLKRNTPSDRWMNDIPTYSLWWIKIHRDYYYYTGDIGYLREQLDYLRELTRMVFSVVGADGRNRVDFKFIDWPSSQDSKAQDAGVHALLVTAIQSLCEIFSVCGEERDKTLIHECRTKMETLGRYHPAHNGNKQSAALLVFAGVEDAVKINRELLSVNPTKGISTFLGYYVLLARGRSGDVTGALNLIREYWGAMLQLGATTFWEDFDLDWVKGAKTIDSLLKADEYDVHGDNGAYCYSGFRHSLCHGWASGPLPFLSEYVLGVSILEPGCRKLRVCGELGDLDWAEGDFPTPFGVVHVRHERTDNGIVTRISAPDEVEIIRG